MLIQGWESEMIDVTTAFLYGDMEEEVYMKLPEGIEYTESGWNSDSRKWVEQRQRLYPTYADNIWYKTGSKAILENIY
jgi:hypothetical protein